MSDARSAEELGTMLKELKEQEPYCKALIKSLEDVKENLQRIIEVINNRRDVRLVEAGGGKFNIGTRGTGVQIFRNGSITLPTLDDIRNSMDKIAETEARILHLKKELGL